MAGAAGPSTAEAGLVFAYDTGNIITSYIGEPTTNIAYATNNNLNSGANWWVNGGNATFNDNDTSIPKPSIPNVDTSNLRIFSSLVTAGGSSQQLGSSIIPISPSTTYSFSIWYYFTGTTMAAYPYIRTAVNNDAIGVFSYNGNTDGTTWPKNQWILLKATGTTQANETGIYMSSYTGTAVGDKVHYFGYQVEQKGHCTPLVLGTRSATQGLLDLGGSSSINLTDVSFNADAQIVFDGTNDRIALTPTDYGITNQFTIEVVCYPTQEVNGMFNFLGNNGSDRGIMAHWPWSSDYGYLDITNTDGGFFRWYKVNAGILNVKAMYHFILNPDGQVVVKQNNQVMVPDGTTPFSGTVSLGLSNTIGAFYANGSLAWGGSIYMFKIYKRALTDAETTQNYEAVRKRFGI